MTVEQINESIAFQKQQLLSHSLYSKIKTLPHLHCFLETHVYAVWDFMSLLKALQNQFTCTSIPWQPTKNAEIRYLINEIVLAEESDLSFDGSRLSHFEIYLLAMEACGANTKKITSFLSEIKTIDDLFLNLEKSNILPGIKDFLNFTFEIIQENKPHKIAAAFTFGREDLIPNMFSEILKKIATNFPKSNLKQLIYYFERHIELDSDKHSPMAIQMIKNLCENDTKKWNEAKEVSVIALKKRIVLWNCIEKEIEKCNL